MKKNYLGCNLLLLLFFFLPSGILSAQVCTVSGAGNTDINGEYIWDGTTTNIDNNPVFEHSSGNYYMHANYFGDWIISDDIDYGTTFYYAYDNDSDYTTPPEDDWEYENGSYPAPTISCSPLDCPIGNVHLNSQAEVDDFIIMYPNCTKLDKFLVISGSSITNLDGLNNLDSLDNVTLENLTSLTSLSELSQIKSISGILRVDNTGISNFAGLNNLTYLKSLLVKLNANLTDLSGVLVLVPLIEETVHIENNPNLTSLNGLNPLPANSPDLDLILWDNPVLTDISALSNVTALDRFFLRGCPNLTSLSGLGNLSSIQVLDLENTALTNLTGLENLSSITYRLELNSPSITDFSALQSLSNIEGSLNIRNLSTLNGLDNLTTIDGFLNIFQFSLTDLSGLENLNTIGGFQVQQTGLTSFDGLNLSAINKVQSEYIYINNNPNLANISALEGAAINNIDYIQISNNPNLSMCSVDGICGMINSMATTVFSNNDTNCNSEAEVLAGCNSIGPGSNIPTIVGTYVATVAEENADGYTYYGDANGNLLIAIKPPAGVNIPPSAVQVKVGATLSTFYNRYCDGTRTGGCFIQQSGGGALINRFWDIDKSQVTGGTISSTTPIDIKIYFMQADFDALNLELTNNGQTALANHTDLQTYVVKNTANLPDFPVPNDIGNYRKVYKLRNAAAASTSRWLLGNPKMDIYSLELKVIRIDNGGGLGKFF